jgi:hypothetical protein
MSINTYELTIEDFALKHYVKAFEKKYKKAWDITLFALQREFQSFDVLLQKSIAEVISDKSKEVCICKVEFKISGTQESRHGSGNRCIVALNKGNKKIHLLLVYHKSHLGNGNETLAWKSMVREDYPQYGEFV